MTHLMARRGRVATPPAGHRAPSNGSLSLLLGIRARKGRTPPVPKGGGPSSIDMFKLPERQRPIRVGFYLARRFSILPFINAVDPLRMANRLSNRTLFEWRFISSDGKPVEAINGMTIMVDLPLEEAGFIPNVVCCVGFDPIIEVRDPVKSWLRKLNSMGAHLGALGAGTLFLAEPGLLNGYRATIHWQYRDSLVERFPDIKVTRNVFEIDRNRFTCAGGTAAMDMMLHAIGLQFGHALAAAVSDEFVTGEVREPSSHQRLSYRTRLGLTDLKILRVIDFMERHIEDPIGLPLLAEKADMSQRQMERLFKSQVQMSPIRFYTRLRLQQARRLLHQSDMSVLEAAVASGFRTAEHFSRSYKSEFGVSPTEDRRIVRGLGSLDRT